MPDWTYHPFLRPVGIALHGNGTRSITLRHLERIASVAAGRWLIRFLGHMAPPSSLVVKKNGLNFASPVMLSSTIDPSGIAFAAFSQFEFGAIELGSATGAHANKQVSVVERYVPERAPSSTSIVRCELPELADALALKSAGVVVDVDAGTTRDQFELAMHAGAAGFVIEDSNPHACTSLVHAVRTQCGATPVVCAGGYVTTPLEALELKHAGADVVIVGEGLAEAGPGIAKRINEALSTFTADAHLMTLHNWVSGTLFGLGVLVAGLIAMFLATTTVVLGYDEQFVGLSREQLAGVNDRLLDFMAHDRLSYAGATLSVGVLYTALAMFGMRNREAWAIHAFAASGVCGFLSFVMFTAFGYFDRGNAAVALVLLPFLVVAVVRPPASAPPAVTADLINDTIWRRFLLGQLLLVVMAAGLIMGGITICVVGSTNVFVLSDLHYLHATSDSLRTASDRLLPLIAHDRVSFGGAIICNGVAALLMSMWGLKRGASWTWWALFGAGSINLAFTFYAHFSTSYTELGHLLPVGIGAAFFITGLILTRPYLCER